MRSEIGWIVIGLAGLTIAAGAIVRYLGGGGPVSAIIAILALGGVAYGDIQRRRLRRERKRD